MNTQEAHNTSSSFIPLLCCAMILLFIFGGASSHHRGGGSSSLPVYVGGSSNEQPEVDPAHVAKIIAANKALVVKMKEAGWKTLVSENRDDPNDPYVIMAIEKKGSEAIWPTISMVEEPQITAIFNGAKVSVVKDYTHVSGTAMIRDGRVYHFEITFLSDNPVISPSRLTYRRFNVSGGLDEYAESVLKLGKWHEVTRVEDKTLIHYIEFRVPKSTNDTYNDVAGIDLVTNEKSVLDAFGTI